MITWINLVRNILVRRYWILFFLTFLFFSASLESWGNSSSTSNNMFSQMTRIPSGKFLIRSGVTGPPNDLDPNVEWIVTSRSKNKLYNIFFKVEEFSIDLYEVTNQKYAEFINETKHRNPSYLNDSRFNKPSHPVVGVSFYDAEAYCAWENKRLPTEAEWEKAARGINGYTLPWGNLKDPYPNVLDRANFNPIIRVGIDYFTTDFAADGFHYLAPVDSYQLGISPYGVFQMAGNVSEWVKYPYKLGQEEEKKLFPSSPGTWGLQKGGAWLNLIYRLLATKRRWSDKKFRHDFSVGFRCAKDGSWKN